jgi:uroporphyrinogen-III decarboxylase
MGSRRYDFSEGLARVSKALSGVPDRPPVLAQIHEHGLRFSRLPLKEYYYDPTRLVDAVLEMTEHYGLDVPLLTYDYYNIEAEALGQRLLFPNQGAPLPDPDRPLLRFPEDVESLGRLDPHNEGRMPLILEALETYEERSGLPPTPYFCAPFSLAAGLLGFPRLIKAVYKDPTSLQHLLGFLTEEVLAPWLQTLEREFPRAPRAIGVDAWASPPSGSLHILQEFSLPYLLDLRDRLKIPVVITNWYGESSLKDPRELLELKLQASPQEIMGQDPDVEALGPKLYKDFAVEKGVSLTLSLSPSLLSGGPVEAIRERVRSYGEVGRAGGRFLFHLGNVGADTPPNHIRAAVGEVRSSGGGFDG